MNTPYLAIIGGSGLYAFEGLENTRRHAIDTPYGAPSCEILTGDFSCHRLAFLARHGEQHSVLPHRVNYRANLWALHSLGVRRVVAVNAVGGIRADMGSGTMVVPDQLIDYSYGRYSSFYDTDNAKVKHVEFAEPYTQSLRQDLLAAMKLAELPVIAGGCYGVTQGPRFETRAEIARMRRDGCDLVGMTSMPEAVLACELGMDYACLALVSNFAAGCGDGQAFTVEEILKTLSTITVNVPPVVLALLKLQGAAA